METQPSGERGSLSELPFPRFLPVSFEVHGEFFLVFLESSGWEPVPDLGLCTIDAKRGSIHDLRPAQPTTYRLIQDPLHSDVFQNQIHQIKKKIKN